MNRVESFEILSPEISVQWTSGEIELLQSTTNTTRITLSGEGKGSDRLIEEAIISAHGNRISIERADKSKTFHISIDRKKKSNSVRIGPAFFGIESGVKIQIEHPHAASLRVKVISANVTGATEIDAIDVFTVSGNTHFTGQSKEIRIKSVSGDTNLNCSAQNRTVVSTVSGSTNISALGAGSIEIKSVSGDSLIAVSSGLMVDVDSQTQTGKLTSDIPLDGLVDHSTEGRGTLHIQTKSLSGNTQIVRVA